MKTTILSGLGVLALGGLFVSACSTPIQQESATPPTANAGTPTTVKPEVSINAVMVALVDHAGHQLWNVEVEGRLQRPTPTGRMWRSTPCRLPARDPRSPLEAPA
jgi:hypothetical protein